MKKLFSVLFIVALLTIGVTGAMAEGYNSKVLRFVFDANAAITQDGDTYTAPAQAAFTPGSDGQLKLYGTAGYTIFLVNQSVPAGTVQAYVQYSPDGVDWLNVQALSTTECAQADPVSKLPTFATYGPARFWRIDYTGSAATSDWTADVYIQLFNND